MKGNLLCASTNRAGRNHTDSDILPFPPSEGVLLQPRIGRCSRVRCFARWRSEGVPAWRSDVIRSYVRVKV